MSFIQRELDRIGARLREADVPPDQYERLYAAQQALAWVLEPEGVRAPYESVMSTPAGSADCSEHTRPAQS